MTARRRRVPGGIFISYRRHGASAYAGRLRDTLALHFGAEKIFQDIESIEPGELFAKRIQDALKTCDVLLALIDESWLESTDAKGNRKLDHPGDYVRTEISAALRRDDVLVVPVLIGGARMPERGDLPDELEGLVEHNALRLSTEGWNDEVRRLVRTLDSVVNKRRRVPPGQAGPAGGGRRRAQIVLSGLAAVGGVIALAHPWVTGAPPSPCRSGAATQSIDVPLPAASDTWVNESTPSKNHAFGSPEFTSELFSRGFPGYASYLRFVLPPPPNDMVLCEAMFRIHTTSAEDAGTKEPGTERGERHNVWLALDAWVEQEITWDKTPPLIRPEIGQIWAPDPNTSYVTRLDAARLQDHLGTAVTLAVTNSMMQESRRLTDRLVFWGTEEAPKTFEPQLLLTFRKNASGRGGER